MDKKENTGNLINETIELLECLPDEDLLFVNELVKKLIKAWDPDYTKLTKKEEEELEKTFKETDYISHEEMWR